MSSSPRMSLQVMHGLDLSSRVSPSWTVEVICSAYQRLGPLKVLIQSFLNQTASNWMLHVIHDGPSKDFDILASEYEKMCCERLRFTSSDKRYNDFGHSLRELGLRESKGDYILITNDDNYYIPEYIHLMNLAIGAGSPDIIMFDMIHSHEFPGNRIQESYMLFSTSFMCNSIDMGSALVKGDLARRANFGSKGFAADWEYFSSVVEEAGSEPLKLAKVPKVLFVHN